MSKKSKWILVCRCPRDPKRPPLYYCGGPYRFLYAREIALEFDTKEGAESVARMVKLDKSFVAEEVFV